MRKGTTHVNTVVTSEPKDGFPNFSAKCECGWKSVIHHQESGAKAEGVWHNFGATRAPGAER